MSEHKYNQQLLNEYRKRLRILENQHARLGSLYVSPHVVVEIDEIQAKIKELEANLYGAEPENLNFLNQQKALGTITQSSYSGNVIITAPAGYGKTYLLEELKPHLNKEWFIHSLSLYPYKGIIKSQQDAIYLICRSLEISYDPNETIDHIGGRIVSKLSRKSLSVREQTFGGAFLIIDSAEHMFVASQRGDYAVLREFFSSINRANAGFESFRVRIILAGRYIVDDRREVLQGLIDLDPLEVFKFETISAAVDTFFQSYIHRKKGEWIRMVAEHVLYITGGHPLMIRLFLVDQRDEIAHAEEYDLQNWLVPHYTYLNQTILVKTLDMIRSDIPEYETLWPILERLCIYRKFSVSMMRDIFPEQQSIVQRVNELERYGLATKKGGFYSDGVLRPAILRWRQFLDDQGIRQECQIARKILANQLTKLTPGTMRSQEAICELLYIGLLECHELILSIEWHAAVEALENLSSKMRGYIHEANKFYQEHSDSEPDEFMQELHRTLREDTELRFLFNYLFSVKLEKAAHIPANNQQTARSLTNYTDLIYELTSYS